MAPREESPLVARLSRFVVTALLCVLATGAPGTASAAPAKRAVRPAVKPASQAAPTAPGTAPGTRKALVIEGDDHLFMVSAPDGWVVDDTSGLGSRIRCVLYPKGQTWASAPTAMYVNPLHGYSSRERTVSTLMADDQRSFLKRSPRGSVTDGGTLATGTTKKAQLRYFAAEGAPPHEAVAYVPERDLVMLLVLTAQDPKQFQRALPAYREMVASYAWVASNKELGR